MNEFSEQELKDLVDGVDTWIDEFNYKHSEKLARMEAVRIKVWDILKKRLADRGYEIK